MLCLLVAAYLVLVIVAVTLLGVLLGAGLLVGVSSCFFLVDVGPQIHSIACVPFGVDDDVLASWSWCCQWSSSCPWC